MIDLFVMVDIFQKKKIKKADYLRRIDSAIRFSIAGLLSAIKTEAAFRTEVTFLVPTIGVLFFLGLDAYENLMIVAAAFFVLVCELLNTAVEVSVDRISLEKNERSRVAKDVASAAVFLSVLLYWITWAFVIYKNYFT